MFLEDFLTEYFEFDYDEVCEDDEYFTAYDVVLKKDVTLYGDFKAGVKVDAVSINKHSFEISFERLVPREWALPDGGFTDVYQEGLEWSFAENEELLKFKLLVQIPLYVTMESIE